MDEHAADTSMVEGYVGLSLWSEMEVNGFCVSALWNSPVFFVL